MHKQKHNKTYYNKRYPDEYPRYEQRPYHKTVPYVVEKESTKPSYNAHYTHEVANIEVHQGEVYMVDLPTDRNTEEAGKRPCVVVSSDKLNSWSTTVVIVPLTKQIGNISTDMHYPFVWKRGMLSVALCNHVRELDKEFLLDKIETLDKLHVHNMLHIIKERVLEEDA